MKILHYSLGFPPYRSGGMTTFCMDIMQEQLRLGHQVALLWPGEMKLFDKRISIEKRQKNQGIISFELMNPLPVALDEGIVEVERFISKIQEADSLQFRTFLQQEKPDVLHIHTFMGLYREFLEIAKDLGIQMVFTSHDYYPICPRLTLYRNQGICQCATDCSGCPECNKNALAMWKIWLMQSPCYRGLKDSLLVKKLRSKHRSEFWSEAAKEETKEEGNSKLDYNKEEENRESQETISSSQTTPEDYQKLKAYYFSMLALMDVIHFNSEVAKEAYLQYIDIWHDGIIHANESDSYAAEMAACEGQHFETIHITNSAIGDHRRMKQYKPATPLHITYLGPASTMKGFPMLKQALDRLWQERQDFVLNLYFEPYEKAAYMRCNTRYDYASLEQVMDQADVVVVPSTWRETFGFVAIEALSYGVPVIVSDQVGAKDVMPEGCGLIVEDMNAEKLAKVIDGLTPEKLQEMNRNILEKLHVVTLEEMTRQIMEKCYC